MKVSEVDEVIVANINQDKFSEKEYEAHKEVAATATLEEVATPAHTPVPAKSATPVKAEKKSCSCWK